MFEKIGRLQMELDALRERNDLHLRVFAEVLTGTCDPSRVLVNLTDGTVTWAAKGERPAVPARINGLPVCVTAPRDEPEISLAEFNGRALPAESTN